NARRAQTLKRMCERMRTTSVRVVIGDAAGPAPDPHYDRVLVDPPCSGLGTLQSRPDIRWRASPQAMKELAGLQRRILAAAADATAPGGALTYSVCTISGAEGAGVVEGFLTAHTHFSRDGDDVQLLPHSDGTDGFFIAR